MDFNMLVIKNIINRFYKIPLFSIFLLISTTTLYSGIKDEEWELVKEDAINNIRIYYQVLPSGNVEFKGITHVTTSLSSFIALFDDVDAMPKWVYRTEEVIKLGETSQKEVYTYTIHTMPFPFKNRDCIIHASVFQNLKNFSVTITGKGTPDYIPRKKDYVRITAVKSFWRFTPNQDGSIEVIFQGYGEPGGSIPSSIYRSPVCQWLCKFYLWRLPHTTLKNMKKIIKRTKYQKRTFKYIKEPFH